MDRTSPSDGRPLDEWIDSTEWSGIRSGIRRIAARAARGTRIEPDDLVHVLYCKALAGDPPRFRVAGELLGWMRVTARNAVHDQRRKAENVRIDLLGELPENAAVQHDHTDALLLTQVLRQAVDQLPPKERQAVHAVIYEDRTFEDAARELGLAASTVRYRFYQGCAQLHRQLTADGGVPGVVLALPALCRRLSRPAILGTPLVGTVAAVLAVGVLGAPVEAARPHATRPTLSADRPERALDAAGGWLEPARPASPRAPHRESAPPWTPDAGRRRPSRLTVTISYPGGRLCVGGSSRTCGGDRLSVRMPDEVVRVMGGAGQRLDGMGVQSSEEPLCRIPTTPVTRCDPGSRP